jgi:hypothetical protein
MGLATGLYLSSILVVAVAHSFDIERYLTALAPLALAAMMTCILEVSGALWRSRTPAADGAAHLAPVAVPEGLAAR